MKKHTQQLMAIVFLLTGTQAFADCKPETTSGPSLTTGGAIFYFDTTPINSEEQAIPSERQLVLISKNCTSGEEKKIDSMPFLAETGIIEEIFITKSPRKIFIIHKAEIRSDTGIPYSSAYHTVLAYTPDGLNSSLDRDLTDYFSFGADILENDNTKNIYTFPYKTKTSIENELKSKSFKTLTHKESLHATISRKTQIYNEPIITENRNSHLINGDKILITKKQANWCNMNYETKKKKLISGWIFCSNLSISDQQTK